MPAARYQIPTPRIVHESIDGEVIIIDFDSGSYFSLTGSGAALWALIEQTATVGQIVDGLHRHFEGDRETISQAVTETLGKLEAARLIEPAPDGETRPEIEAEASGEGRPAFSAPVFQQFTDMQSLLLLDPIHDVDQTGWPHVAPPASSE